MQNPFPKTKTEFFQFCENFSANVFKASNQQIRRKASWFGAQMANSLPNQSDNFNVNTLIDLLAKNESGHSEHQTSEMHKYIVTYHQEGDSPRSVLFSAPSPDEEQIHTVLHKTLCEEMFGDDQDDWPDIEIYIDSIQLLDATTTLSV